MKIFSKLKLNTRLILTIISVVVIIYSLLFGFVVYRMGPVIRGEIEGIADNNVAKYANLFKSYLSEDMMISRTISDNLETYLPLSPEEKIKRTEAFLNRVYKKNPSYKAVYVSWERRFVDSTWNKKYGRIRITLYGPPKTNNDRSSIQYDTLNTFGDDINSSYYQTKVVQKDVLANPYKDDYYGVIETVTSVFTPMVYEGEFLGAAGVDIPLSTYADIIDKAEKFYNSNIFLLSNDGVFVGNQVKELVGKSIRDITKDNVDSIILKVKKGKAFSMYNTVDGIEYYVTYYPFNVTGADTPWMVGIAMPVKDMRGIMINNFKALVIVGILGLLIMLVIVYFIAKGISKPISKITKVVNKLAKGEIDKANDIKTAREDEIGEIVSSSNALLDNLRKTEYFAQEIGKGNLDSEYQSLNENDVLGNSLLNMRKSLKKANEEEEKRRENERMQSWATTGYAKFGELLRHSTDNMEAFTYNVISNLVKYTNSNQGALFLLNTEDDNDSYLVMSASYAYSRMKYKDKRIEIGEGLVGQCFQEEDRIYMTDVPEGYTSITSGLGEAKPNTILLVPLKFNEKVYGVIELSSFYKYDDYHISFIEQLAESIASTISSVRVNLQTVQLLEESKLKSEELAAQEEEMRQNMEELQTTQEESARRELDMNGILDALNSSYIVMELDVEGNIININENAKRLLDVSNDIVEGKNLRSLLTNEELEEFESLWKDVLAGETVTKQHKIVRGANAFTISESYTPVYNDMGDIVKVLNIGVEVKND
ncbi:MAG: hypothetical protein DRI86_01615 [Bacteroidetes bacterium]|nr:MAG: hypothetical protein DRI86_01615 [Bacteroidota bacterium]